MSRGAPNIASAHAPAAVSATAPAGTSFIVSAQQQQSEGTGAGTGAGTARRREVRAAGAARLFGYLEASDGSGDEYEAAALGAEYATAAPAPVPPTHAPHYARDKENAAPLHHAGAGAALHHDHCLRY